MPARGIRFEPPRTNVRDAVLFVLAVIVPFGFVAAFGLRAADNEEAALVQARQRSADATAERARNELDVELSRATAALAGAEIDAPADTPPDPEALFATAARVAPRFGRAWVLDASLRVVFPRQTMPAPDGAGTSGERRRTCARHLDALRAGDAAARAAFVDACEDHRAEGGRMPWSTLAIQGLSTDPSPQAIDRIGAWLSRHAGEMRPAEREANRREIEALVAVPSATRDELVRRLAAGEVEDDDPFAVLRTEEPRSALARAEREGSATFRGRAGLGAVRFVGGHHVGFVVARSDVTRALAQLPAFDPALSLSVVTDDAPVREGEAVAYLAPGLGIRAASREAAALAEVASASRTRILATVVAALAMSGALVAVLWARVVRARRLAELRTGFVAAVSHELRTPIASLRLLGDLLDDEAMPPDERREIVAAVRKETLRLSVTVERFLDFSRLGAEGQALSRERIALADVVRRAVETFRERHPEREVALERMDEAPCDLDAGKVEVAVENLLENARRHAPDAGPIRVSVRAETGSVALAVADAGPGVPPAMRERIFAPFERGDDRMTRATEGTGLGLALVRAIARAHGGDAHVVAGDPVGATFVIRFPLGEA